MAESVEARTPQLATELPSKYLPAVSYRDLPEPRGLRKYLGASIILTATALGSGELVLWPYITTQVGLGTPWSPARQPSPDSPDCGYPGV